MGAKRKSKSNKAPSRKRGSKKQSNAVDLPSHVLYEVSWVFRGAVFSDRTVFDAAVSREQAEADCPWRPDDILPCPQLKVSYWGVVNPGDVEYTQCTAELTSDNGEYFTAAELLFKVHNAVVHHLRDADHQFFEGLSLSRGRGRGGTPMYEMQQGS